MILNNTLFRVSFPEIFLLSFLNSALVGTYCLGKQHLLLFSFPHSLSTQIYASKAQVVTTNSVSRHLKICCSEYRPPIDFVYFIFQSQVFADFPLPLIMKNIRFSLPPATLPPFFFPFKFLNTKRQRAGAGQGQFVRRQKIQNIMPKLLPFPLTQCAVSHISTHIVA